MLLTGLASDGNWLFAARPITKRNLSEPTSDQVDFWLKKLAKFIIKDKLASTFNAASKLLLFLLPRRIVGLRVKLAAVESMALQGFPRGYKLWLINSFNKDGTPREDLLVYGHPSGQEFRSPGKFFEHLKWLIQERPTEICPCERSKMCGDLGTVADDDEESSEAGESGETEETGEDGETDKDEETDEGGDIMEVDDFLEDKDLDIE